MQTKLTILLIGITFQLFGQADKASIDFQQKIQSIENNCERINLITNWSDIQTKELWETTEGGEADFYYIGKQLEKIVTHYFGETFQKITEYYLQNGQLSFVSEKLYKYNKPINYKEDDDTEIFDFEKSEIIEFKYYFENEKLTHHSVHQINKGLSPFTSIEDYQFKEQKQIKTEFKELINLQKK